MVMTCFPRSSESQVSPEQWSRVAGFLPHGKATLNGAVVETFW